MAKDSGVTMVLLACVAEIACAIPVADVIETMRTLPTSALAGTPPYVAGVSIVRGQPLPVPDLGALLQPGENAAPGGRFVVVRVGKRAAIISVDRVSGVRSLDNSTFCGLPPLLGSADAGVLSSLGRLDHDLLVMLDASRAISPELLAQIDAMR